MLNLHSMARGAINAVNPDQPVAILQSDGFEIVDYEQKPRWKPAIIVMAQAQPVADKTVQLLKQQRQNSIWRDFYLPGNWNGLRRPDEKGGDLLYWNGFEWQVDQILEAWAPGSQPNGFHRRTKARRAANAGVNEPKTALFGEWSSQKQMQSDFETSFIAGWTKLRCVQTRLSPMPAAGARKPPQDS